MKFACLAAAAAATLLALPAAAADLRVSRTESPVVRISLIGKTDSQVSREIADAAGKVCEGEGRACVQASIRQANRQYAAIKRSRDAVTTKVEVIREDRATVRVKLAGRSIEQIHADIDAAAKTVCKAVGGADFRGCVDKATRNAKNQLRDMQLASTDRFAAR